MKHIHPTGLVVALCLFVSSSVLLRGGEFEPAPIINDKAPIACGVSKCGFDTTRNTFLGFIHQDFDHGKLMLDWQRNVTEKPLKLLEYEQGVEFRPGVTVSGAFWGNHLSETTNTVRAPFGGFFPILSRFPNERGNFSRSSERWVVSNAAFASTIQPTNWLRFYSQIEFSEVEFPGQEDWTWRKYLGIIGDLDRFPFYAYYGRNTGDFGWMDGYNPFTHTVNNHFYRVESEQPIIGLGYKSGGLHVIANLIHSGRQLRVADTAETEGYQNGSINVSYKFGECDKYLKVGVGYLHDTIYNSVIAHHPDTPTEIASRNSTLIHNPAFDIYAELRRGNFRLGFERTETFKDWPATRFDVAATTVQGSYDFCLGRFPSRLSAVWGLGRQGPSGEEYERLTQFVLGLETDITPFFSIAAEWVHNEGFVPLINITRVSDADVVADALIIGGKVTF